MTASFDTVATAVQGADAQRYLTFALAGESYALPIRDVTEILEHRPLTVVPLAPSHVRGVINLRGRAVPVVDLLSWFGQGFSEVGRRTAIVIVDVASGGAELADGVARHVGILVDAVNSVMHLDTDDLEPPPAFGSGGYDSELVAGMARHEDRFVVVLDLRGVLGGIAVPSF
jgi:purine-binding chemotaxis protein CheW